MNPQWLDDIIADKGERWVDKRRKEARDSYEPSDEISFHAFETAYIKRAYVFEKQQELPKDLNIGEHI